MKDPQGTNVINPETMLIIRNLRQKAIHEDKGRDFYVDSFLTDYTLIMHAEGLTPMAAFELYGQEWCIKNNIIGYDYIANVSFANVRRKNE